MKLSTRICFVAAISVVMLGSDLDTSAPINFCFVNDAEAVIGRPLTPLSVAGVRRRTRRRTAVATAVVVAAPVVAAPAPVVVAPPPPQPEVIYVPAPAPQPEVIYVPVPAPAVNAVPAQLTADQAACQKNAIASSGYDPANPEAYTKSYNECMTSRGY